MIKRLNDLSREAYNPIRKHIQITFELCKNEAERLQFITDYLAEKNFKIEISRVLIFVRTRRMAENAADELGKLVPKALKKQVGFFHAGLSAEEREEAVNDFRDGARSILCTTKAFGMGMDIPNVHFVFHLGPSSTFEDFLQEIGRAGRNQDALIRAGLSEDNPIRTVCLLTAQDFPKLKDLMQRSQLSWMQVQELQEQIEQLFAAHKIPKNDILPLPLTYYTEVASFAEDNQSAAETNFRLALHWLERLGRIELGFYLPAHLEFDTSVLVKSQKNLEHISDTGVRNLVTFLLKEGNPSQPITMVSLPALKQVTGKKTNQKLFQLLAFAHKNGHIKLVHRVKFSIPKQSQEEFKYTAARDLTWHTSLEILFKLAEEFIRQIAPGQEIELDSETTNTLLKETVEDYFQPPRFPWLEPASQSNLEEKRREWTRRVKKIRDAFMKKGRGGYAKGLNGVFRVIRTVPGVQHRLKFKTRSLSQLIQRSPKLTDRVLTDYLNTLRKDCYWLLNLLYRGYRKDATYKLDLLEALNKLSQPDIKHLEHVILILGGTLLIKNDGGLLPMAIELSLKQDAPIDIEANETDRKVFEQFVIAQKLRRIRLTVLAGLSEISAADYSTYINEYFQCSNYEQIVQLLDNYLPANSSLLSEFREEALNKAEAELNPQQKEVYDFSITENLNVIAGPGSGKTHTLTLRVARLIHKEHIPPTQILVLAYNRAVVVELKERLRRLFKKLGYNKLTSSLKVFTFHGFIKFCLGEELDGIEFNQYAHTFIRRWQSEPGWIEARMGPIRYVFVDEFQDITGSRLEALKIIANPAKQRYITVIGDPNQSIYGFDRKAEGDPISPEPFYRKFKEYFAPGERQLTVNYRSFPLIIERAQTFLKYNEVTFGMPPLTAFQTRPDLWQVPQYCEEISPENDNWVTCIQGLLSERSPSKGPYNDIAVMFRTNDELYRGFCKLKGKLPKEIRIRIQGESDSLLRIREVAWIVDRFIRPNEAHLDSPLPERMHESYKKANVTKDCPPHWNRYLLDSIEASILEYEKERTDSSTYLDLLDFLHDISRGEDGQLAKFYNQNAQNLTSYSQQTTLVLTTMHKVKGLEFDAVVIPPSYASLPFNMASERHYEISNSVSLKDTIEEERRLRFVALSRARFRLVCFPWQREAALIKGTSWSLTEGQQSKLGKPVRAGLDKFDIDWVATQPSNLFQFIHNSVSVGDEVTLVASDRAGKWNILVKGIKVGETKPYGVKGFTGEIIAGFSVTNVFVRYYQDTVRSDQEKGTNFARRWQNHAIQTGYTYIVDFAGYGNYA